MCIRLKTPKLKPDFWGSSVSHSKHGIWLAAGGSRANNIAGYVRIFYGHFPFAGRDVFYSNFIRWPLEDRADREKVSIKLIILNLF